MEAAALGEVEGSARSRAVEGKGVVTGIVDVAAPEVEGEVFRKIETGMGTQYGIGLLGVGVGFVPVDAATGAQVGTESECVQHLRLEGDAIFQAGSHRMGGNEGG